MLFPLTKMPVNWTDGMKITKEHLSDTEDYFIDLVRDAVNLHLTGYSFGLLPPYRDEKISNDFEIMERTTERVEIELRKCNAITAGGCRIDINPKDHTGYLKLDYTFGTETERDGRENLWDVILIVYPFGRVPVGVPDPDENPPRHPYADRAYRLSVVPHGQINAEELGMHNLIIGRIAKNGNRYDVDKTYIPPCTSMMSHPDLKKYCERFGKYLNDIEVSSHKIIQKILDRDNSISIAMNTQLLCEYVLTYVVSIYFRYKHTGRSFSPLEITDIIASFAHVCYVALNFISSKKRAEMLQYFYEWSDVSPGNFTELLIDMLESTYDHNNIRVIMERMENFLSVFSGLWLKLSSLEYIGQHRENVVVAVQNRKQETTSPKTGWTIVD